MTNWRLIFCAIMAGAILPLAFAPYSYLPLVYLSLGGWYTTIRMVSRQSSATPYRQSFLLGFMFGLGWFSGVAWVFVTLVRFGGLPLPLAVLATVLFCAYLALYPALVALIFQRFLRRGILHPQQKTHSLLNPTIFASLFTLLEWLRGILLTGFPWLNIGYAHAVENSFMAWFSLSALAPWVGVLGITWMNVWLACVVAEIGLWQVERYASIPTSDRVPTNWAQAKLFLCFAMVVGAIGTLSAFPVRWTTPLGQPITVQMVQGNTPIHLKWDPEQYERRLQHYTQLIQDHATPRPHLILLPETALSRFDFPASQDFVANTINQGSALLIGGILLENQGAYNSVGLFEQNQPDQYYSKVHLVPFGEYPPMGFAWFAQQLSIPMADLRAGVAPQRALFLHELPFAVSICYENLFPQAFRRWRLRPLSW